MPEKSPRDLLGSVIHLTALVENLVIKVNEGQIRTDNSLDKLNTELQKVEDKITDSGGLSERISLVEDRLARLTKGLWIVFGAAITALVTAISRFFGVK